MSFVLIGGIGIAILVVGGWLVVGAIVWTTHEAPPGGGDSEPGCIDCDEAQRKWRSMDWWAKAAAFLTYTGTIANCALKRCQIGY